jgi:hypothetical protein
MESPSTVSDLIAAIGVSALARHFGHENVSTVSSWKLRGSIPVIHWPRLVEIAAETGIAGVSYETLVGMHAGSPHPSAPTPDPAP